MEKIKYELNTATSGSPEYNEVSNTPLDIEKMVSDEFAYTIKKDPRNNKIVLSADDFNNLVKWVTFYFQNGYKVPEIKNSIKSSNFKVIYIRYTFKKLFDDVQEEMLIRNILKRKNKKRENLSALASKCFFSLKDDDKNAISRTGKPKSY